MFPFYAAKKNTHHEHHRREKHTPGPARQQPLHGHRDCSWKVAELKMKKKRAHHEQVRDEAEQKKTKKRPAQKEEIRRPENRVHYDRVVSANTLSASSGVDILDAKL
jgi:predicted  nucleic acid-binding Zn-ribbon protein